LLAFEVRQLSRNTRCDSSRAVSDQGFEGFIERHLLTVQLISEDPALPRRAQLFQLLGNQWSALLGRLDVQDAFRDQKTAAGVMEVPVKYVAMFGIGLNLQLMGQFGRSLSLRG